MLAATGNDGLIAGLVIALLAAVIGGLVWVQREQKRRIAIEHRFMLMQAELGEDREANGKRTDVMFAQQKELNELMIQKLKSEVAVLEAQLAAFKNHPDREEASREAHELMVEKTRLEIDGLRLHNAELRKRMEDWSGGE